MDASKLVGAAIAVALVSCTADSAPRDVDPSTDDRKDDLYDAQHAVATEISEAFAQGEAKRWRLAVTGQLAAMDLMTRDELASALDAYADVAAERGVQGLEATLAASLSSLGHRDFLGWTAAQTVRAQLAEELWTDEHVTARPQAHAAIKSGGDPIVHHVPLELARGLLVAQLDTGVLDLDASFGEDMCSPEAQAAFEARWGAEYAAVLSAACDQAFAGPMGGGFGPGALAGMSEIDCFFDHEPTRAERIGGLMQDCLESQVEGGGGNPFADSPTGSTFDWVFPLRREAYNEPFPSNGEPQSRTHYDNNDIPIYKDEYHDDGSIDRTYYNDAGEKALRVSYDERGNMTYGEAYEGGRKTESVQIHADGSYTVTQYDDMGNPTSSATYGGDGEQQGGGMGGTGGGGGMGGTGGGGAMSPGVDGWGDTAECRELTMALIEDRLEGQLEGEGIHDPRTVNPNPEGGGEEPVDAGALDCFDLAAGEDLDASFGCVDPIAHCPGLWQVLDAQCKCTPAQALVEPDMRCGIYMRCADGVPPTEVNGQCECAGEEIFTDPAAGGGPRPQPVDRNGLPGGFD